MKVLFHENSLNIRGTSIALFDYAYYNRKYLNNQSYIVYPKEPNPVNEQKVIQKFKDNFEVFQYEDLNELNDICDMLDIDVAYFIKAGFNDGLLTKKKNVVHSVFQYYEPHGDRYAYVSPFLSRVASNNLCSFVPHMVNLPNPSENYRERYGISEDKIVVGRYGGFDQFDIPWVRDALIEFVRIHPDYVFLFANTRRFTSHPAFIYVDGMVDLQEKSNFINTCNAMIHARSDGESFGLAICEFLSQGKPVFAWNGGQDTHHTEILSPANTLYNSKEDLKDKLTYLKHGYPFIDMKQLVDQYQPKVVMEKFEEVFLSV